VGDKHIRGAFVVSRHVRRGAWKLSVGGREFKFFQSASYGNVGLIGVRQTPILERQGMIDSLQTAIGEVLELELGAFQDLSVEGRDRIEIRWQIELIP
jgi:hypothetical protein